MSIVRQLVHGFRNLLRRKQADQDIADEVDNFFAEVKADFEARGSTIRQRQGMCYSSCPQRLLNGAE